MTFRIILYTFLGYLVAASLTSAVSFNLGMTDWASILTYLYITLGGGFCYLIVLGIYIRLYVVKNSCDWLKVREFLK